MIALFSLFIPWMLLLLTVITITLLIKRKWKYALAVALIALSMNWWSGCFCFGLKNSSSGDIKVFSFNVNGVGAYDSGKVDAVISLIREESPDILYLTENFSPFGDSLHLRLQHIFPYNTREKSSHNVIYSTKMIKEKRLLETVEVGSSAYIIEARIGMNERDVVVYGTHLSSNNYSKDMDYLTPGEVNSFQRIRKYADNIIGSSKLRVREANSIINAASGLDRVIVMGDLNDVCGSETLHTFNNAGLYDSWMEGGFGYGATIHHPLPYRLDHVLHNDGLKLKGIKKIRTKNVSDHDALVAVFDLQ